MPCLGPGGLSAARTGVGQGGQGIRQHPGAASETDIAAGRSGRACCADGSPLRQDLQTMSLNARHFREVVGLFATGVTIIVAEVAGQVHAMTANSVTSVSLDPLLMLFCPSRRARIAQDLPGLTHFSINILRQDQQALSTYFAGGWKDSAPPPQFRFVDSAAGPRLDGALASIGCRTRSV